jgi:hypothetical protein
MAIEHKIVEKFNKLRKQTQNPYKLHTKAEASSVPPVFVLSGGSDKDEHRQLINELTKILITAQTEWQRKELTTAIHEDRYATATYIGLEVEGDKSDSPMRCRILSPKPSQLPQETVEQLQASVEKHNSDARDEYTKFIEDINTGEVYKNSYTLE